MLKINLC